MLTMGFAVQPVVEWLGADGIVLDYQVRFTRPVPVDPTDGAAVTVVAKVGVVDDAGARIDLTVTIREAAQTVLGKAQVRVAPGRGMSLADLTTLRVGGDAASHRRARDIAMSSSAGVLETWAVRRRVAAARRRLERRRSPTTGSTATVIRVVTRGIERVSTRDAAVRPSAYLGDRAVRLRVQAGEPWDALVAHAVANGWAGIEALSGIPGSSGAAPIQNIGAYGQEIGTSLVGDRVSRLPDRRGRTTSRRSQLGLGYRTSLLKQGRQGAVLSIELDLSESTPGHPALSQPIAYPQLADALGVRLGDRVPVEDLRADRARASRGEGDAAATRMTPTRAAPDPSSPTRS